MTKEQIIEKYQSFPDWKTIQSQNPIQNKILIEHSIRGIRNGLMLYKGKKCYYIHSEYKHLKYFSNTSNNVDHIEYGSVHIYYVYTIPEDSLAIMEKCHELYLEMLKENKGIISLYFREKYKQTKKEIYGTHDWIEKAKTWVQVGKFKILNLDVE